MIIYAIHIGRLHPLLVHLPIGILVVAFLLELIHFRRQTDAHNKTIQLVLGIGGVSALVSLATGWLLASDGSYDETLVSQHRWVAVAMTVGMILLYLIKRAAAVWTNKLYFPFFVTVLVLLGITGHLGGSLTHGEDYLFEDTEEVVITDVEEAAVYTDIIQPILNKKCVSCHNAKKIKGGLIMTSKESLLAGGDSGSILDSVPDGEPKILELVHLPIAHKEHMPPKGKLQLTSEEIALLEWWISHENCFDCVVKNLETSEKLSAILSDLEEDTSPRALMAKEVDQVSPKWLATLETLGVSVYPLYKDNPLYIINMSGMKNIDRKKLGELKRYAENIVELNLANSNFNDSLANLILPLKNLTKLQLQGTQITDKTISELKGLKFMESLNLYGTSVTDNSLDALDKLESLKTVYLWQTDISRDRLKQFTADNPQIAADHIREDTFAAAQLEPPAIISETDFFKDTLEVSLANVFEDARLFYTLDGSEPDTTSLIYTKPLVLSKSTNLKAFTYKKGWQPSGVAFANFKKSDMEYETVLLNKPPHEKYSGQGGKTLVDLKRGTNNFVDGNWLGYESSHFTTTLSLKQPEKISTVSVGALSAPASWIFFPTGFTIWTSEDGKNYRHISTVNLPKQEPSIAVERYFFDLPITPTTAKYVRVKINSPLKNPPWHPVPGGASFIFIDEVVLN